MNRKLKGTIEYEIEINEYDVDINFTSTVQNDLAILAIAQYIMNSCAEGQREVKKTLKGREKKMVSENLDYITKGRNGLARVVNLLIDSFESWEEQSKLAESAEERTKQWLKENNVTVESGIISEEETNKLLEKRLRELKEVAAKKNAANFKSEIEDQKQNP